ncbi:MAG: M28 family peptidase [Kiritimatiellae bacterium]|nr:M28 family peptidase [Kiritimatiellia bacterium]
MTLLPILFAAALSFGREDAALAYRTAKDFSATCSPRDAGTERGRMAANYILDHASAVGGNVRLDPFVAMTPDGEMRFVNVVAEFTCGDPDAEWVVLVSHYDTKRGIDSPFANDGASTTGLLVGFANAFSQYRSSGAKGNLMMIWTDGEESFNAYGPDDGLWGSRHAAGKLKREGRKIKAVICLDMLGDADLGISLPANSSKALRQIVHHAAKEAGYSVKVKDIKEFLRDDHVPFLQRGFKAVDMIDFEYGSAPGKNDWWHTPQDTADHISEESLYVSGRIVCEVLNVLLF